MPPMRLALATLLLACAAQAQEPLFVTPDPQSTQPRFFSAFDGHVYFLADAVPDPSQLQGTWRTDGTAAGTEYLFGLNWLGRRPSSTATSTSSPSTRRRTAAPARPTYSASMAPPPRA